MSKDNWLSFGRSLVLVVISYLVGRHVLGHELDEHLLETAGEAIIGVAAAVWGIFDKTTTIEQVQSAFRSLAAIGFSTLATWGIISGQTAIALIGFVSSAIPFLQSVTSKLKVKQIDKGKIVPSPDGSGKLVNALPTGFSASKP